MRWLLKLLNLLMLPAACLPLVTGCGTTRATDTTRAATEQLLISDAIDRAVQSLNLQTLGGQTVFLDDSRLGEVVDRNYLISTLRQQLLASGCLLKEKKEDADFIVEARAGAVGTDRNDLLFGLPSMNLPSIPLVQPVPAMIPEIPIAKRRDQRGIVKIGVFAYHRETGTPVWQSGLAHQESSANDVWILGAGPFQRGTIQPAPAFAGKSLPQGEKKSEPVARRLPAVEVEQESLFTPPQRLVKRTPAAPNAVAQANHEEPASPVAAAVPAAGQAPALPATPPPASVQTADASLPPTPASSDIAPVSKPSAKVEPAAMAKSTESTPLPQPRFNSPR